MLRVNDHVGGDVGGGSGCGGVCCVACLLLKIFTCCEGKRGWTDVVNLIHSPGVHYALMTR